MLLRLPESRGPRAAALYMHVASFHRRCCAVGFIPATVGFFPATWPPFPLLGDSLPCMSSLRAGKKQGYVGKRVLKWEACLLQARLSFELDVPGEQARRQLGM